MISSTKAETIRSDTTPEVTLGEATSVILYQSNNVAGREPVIVHFKPHTIQFASWVAENGYTVVSIRQKLRKNKGLGRAQPILVVTDAQAIEAVKRHYTSIGYTFGDVNESVDGVYVIHSISD